MKIIIKNCLIYYRLEVDYLIKEKKIGFIMIKAKSWFDLTIKEKDKIIKKAVEGACEEQRKLIKKFEAKLAKKFSNKSL